MQAAWSSKPKIDVELALHAPKVAIPIVSGKRTEQVTLLADLGSLTLISNHDEAATLSPEEAAIYECYSLLSSDLSVHIINGTFAWPSAGQTEGNAAESAELPGSASAAALLADAKTSPTQQIAQYCAESAQAVPLLDHCSTSASVHMAYVSHPTLPMVRVGLQVSCLDSDASQ